MKGPPETSWQTCMCRIHDSLEPAVRGLADDRHCDLQSDFGRLRQARDPLEALDVALGIPEESLADHTVDEITSAMKRCPEFQEFPLQWRYYRKYLRSRFRNPLEIGFYSMMFAVTICATLLRSWVAPQRST